MLTRIRIFLFTILLSALTWLAADPGFRVYQQKQIPIFTEFPGDLEAWRVLGNPRNTKVDESGIAIFSLLSEKVRVIRDFSIEHQQGESGIRLMTVEAHISPLMQPVDITLASVASRFHVLQRNSHTKKRYGLFAHRKFPTAGNAPFWTSAATFFSNGADEPSSIKVRSISRQSPEADMLRATMVLHSSGAWKLEDLKIYSSTVSPWYIATLIVVVALWIALVSYLLAMQLKNLHKPRGTFLGIIIVLATLVFALLLPIRGLAIIAYVTGKSPVELHLLFQNNLLLGALVSLHFLFHAAFSLFLLFKCRLGTPAYLTVLMINLGLALAVESWQAHTYTRTAQWGDIATGMLGVAAAVILYCCVSFCCSNRVVK